jgi:hypothetical protein
MNPIFMVFSWPSEENSSLIGGEIHQGEDSLVNWVICIRQSRLCERSEAIQSGRARSTALCLSGLVFAEPPTDGRGLPGSKLLSFASPKEE